MPGPEAGKRIEIQSYKHNGHLHRVWESTTILKGTRHVIIGANDRTTVTESDGRRWVTKGACHLLFPFQVLV